MSQPTKHYVEAYVEHDWIGSRLLCEDPEHCTATAEEYREEVRGEIKQEVPRVRPRDLCSIVEWYKDVGQELLDFPRDNQAVFGRIEVRPYWSGLGDDTELYLLPPKEESDG